MSVVSTQELAQTLEREVGRAAIIKRRIICVLADNTLQNDPATELEVIAAALGISTQQASTSTDRKSVV